MEKDNYKTDVIFRVTKSGTWKGTVYALMPHDCDTFDGLVNSYQHIGQHSSADYFHCIQSSRLATEAEYADLKKEMENGFGYNFNVIKKQNREKFLKSYYKIRKK